jgi:hypothetical protein
MNEICLFLSLPSAIRGRASVEGSVGHTQSFQLAMDIPFRAELPLRLSIRYSPELQRHKQLVICFLPGRSDLPLNVDDHSWNGTDDNVHTGRSLLDGCMVGIS